MNRLNCWEWSQCGHEPGGANAAKGVCPAALERRTDGVNSGAQAGRCCWAISDTSCTENLKFKLCKCLQCEFMAKVQDEEGIDFVLMEKVLQRLNT